MDSSCLDFIIEISLDLINAGIILWTNAVSGVYTIIVDPSSDPRSKFIKSSFCGIFL
jgi:hypothetical protein